VIKNYFSCQKIFINSLRPFGFDNTAYTKFRELCNDKIKAPLDIGRHAPMPEAKLFSFDVRHLLLKPFSYEIFKFSTIFCRQVIDGYIEYLTSQTL
jgi:hypothetical protein